MKKTNIYILCGGKGKRMKKYTKKIPKPLVKVGKMPIIEHKIKYYRSQGFRNIVCCVGYKANKLENFLRNLCTNFVNLSSSLVMLSERPI